MHRQARPGHHTEKLTWIRGALYTLSFAAITILAAGGAPGQSSEAAAPALASAGPAAPLSTHGDDTPRAHAGSARTAAIGETVVLDGSASTSADGRRLTYAWTLHAPAGSGARLSAPEAVRPSFTVDLLGEYRAELTVSNGETSSAAKAVRISTGNVAPVADAGPDRSIRVGKTILLDAARSTDFNGDILRFRWSLVHAPAGSRAQFSGTRSATPAFSADRAGDYVLALVASDGRLDSSPSYVRVSTRNSRPRADAGIDRVLIAGMGLRLDGSDSADPDHKTLDYAWSLLHAPAGSAAALHDVKSVGPLLRTDLPGLYVAQLVVTDGKYPSAPDTVVIEAHAVGAH